VEKKLLRQQAQKRRESLNWLEVQGKSHEITQRVLLLPEYKKARVVMVYLAINNEVDTHAIILNAWQQKKKVLIPVCQPASKTLMLSELRSLDELIPGTWGIPEPKKEYLRLTEPQETELAIIPGLAFDIHGTRLGYGAGYFDRFLPNLPANCPKVAITYELSLTEYLPRESHDIPMDYIITEANTIKVAGARADIIG